MTAEVIAFRMYLNRKNATNKKTAMNIIHALIKSFFMNVMKLY